MGLPYGAGGLAPYSSDDPVQLGSTRLASPHFRPESKFSSGIWDGLQGDGDIGSRVGRIMAAQYQYTGCIDTLLGPAELGDNRFSSHSPPNPSHRRHTEYDTPGWRYALDSASSLVVLFASMEAQRVWVAFCGFYSAAVQHVILPRGEGTTDIRQQHTPGEGSRRVK
ncbi:hypothetical protein B0T26DRAFT_681041 [Lasiosphaeria miniovina]|uniref:Uncharacterized protein n=1 Tax=Lasiosphaeria miniovina TaxID=1954250 RepID=A0AA40DJS8_9PEZI|nr:uncharacterized protein B0T26DRAFT_681041 [Lasiosphaeria miniovina]KAK0703357.1 hypothetical protein B0T26DRAFT_681041 [Lasiosphaeria miniovina]